MQDRLHARIDQYFERALALTTRQHLDRKGVHDLRVFCKKLRGLLRLYRSPKSAPKAPGLTALEDSIAAIGRTLGVDRDTEVLIDLVSAWRLRSPVHKTLQQSLLSLLKTGHRPPVNVSALHLALQGAAQQWQAVSARVDDRHLRQALQRSIKKTQKDGRKALEKARPRRLHAWRKQVKYQYYQLDVLPVTAARGRRYRQLKTLGTVLGDIHDLDMLEDYLQRCGLDTAALIERVKVQRERLLLRVPALFEKTWLDREQREALLRDLT